MEPRNVPFTERFMSSFETLIEFIQILYKRPVFWIPIIIDFISICIFFTILILILIYLPEQDLKGLYHKHGELICFGTLFGIYTIYSICSFMQLEFIRQIETGEKIDIIKSIKKTLFNDIIRGLPILFVWTCIIYILNLFRRKNNKYNPNAISRILINQLTNFFEENLTIVVFYMYAAIAWENKSPIKAVEKGFYVAKNTLGEIVIATIQVEFVGLILIIPAVIIAVYLRLNPTATLTTLAVLSLIYLAYGMLIACLHGYIMQMFSAITYMWYKKWEKETIKASVNKTPLPTLYDIPKPSLLDDIPDLIMLNNKK